VTPRAEAPADPSGGDGGAALIEKMLLKDAPAPATASTAPTAAPSASAPTSVARPKNLPVVKQLPKKQKVAALVQVTSTKPGSSTAVADKVLLIVTFTAATKDNFNNKVAVKAGDEVRLTVGLPSIMQADEELILEYFDNLVDGLYVTHDSNAGTNTASIAIGGRIP
jgi:hypothetical protein